MGIVEIVYMKGERKTRETILLGEKGFSGLFKDSDRFFIFSTF